jgi:hypothetical protein
MISVDQFLAALASVESSNNPQAWGDHGRAVGRWQVHPDRLFDEAHRNKLYPELAETWDGFIERILRAIFAHEVGNYSEVEIAMYWHIGHRIFEGGMGWDAPYAEKFNEAINV